MESLNNLYLRLLQKGRSKNSCFPGTFFDLPVFNGKEVLNVMPTLCSDTIRSIAESALRGNIDDMLTLSMFYNVGLGLPEDKTMAMSWANYSIVEPAPVSFKKACAQLRQEIAELPSHSYPPNLDTIYSRVKESVVDLSQLPKSKSYVLSPFVAGKRIYAIYRVKDKGDKKVCYLYDVRSSDGSILDLSIVNKLNLPHVLGAYGFGTAAHRLRNIVPDYHKNITEYIGKDASYFVVSGTLTIPNNVRETLKLAFPRVRSVSDLLSHIDPSESKCLREAPEYVDIKNKIKAVEAKIDELKSGTLFRQLKEKYAHTNELRKEARAAKDKVKFDEHTNALLLMRERSEEIKDGTLLKSLRRQLKKCREKEVALRPLNAEQNIAWHRHNPHKLLRFVASAIYYGKKSSVDLVPVGPDMGRHLRHLGFDNVANNAFDTYPIEYITGESDIESRIQSIYSKFTTMYSDYRLAGLIMIPRDSKTVKKGSSSKRKQHTYILTDGSIAK